MSRGPEAAFWREVRTHWPGHAVRVEAGAGEVSVGTPDCVLSIGMKGGWIELKVWPDNVSAEQLAWHIDADQRGAYARVLVKMPGSYVWLGMAQEYDAVVSGKSPKILSRDMVHLQEALDRVRCDLIGQGKGRR